MRLASYIMIKNLNRYFYRQVHMSVRPSIRHIFLLKSPWDHPPGVDLPHDTMGERARFTAGKLSLGSAHKAGTY